MLKENQERIAWFDNPTERMKHTGQAIRDAAEKGGYGLKSSLQGGNSSDPGPNRRCCNRTLRTSSSQC